MEVAGGANPEIFVELVLEERLAALLTLDPQPFGNRLLGLGGEAFFTRPPRHGG